MTFSGTTIIDIQGLTAIKIFGYVRTTDPNQAGSYAGSMYQFFRAGPGWSKQLQVHITSLPEPATIGLMSLSLGTLGLLRKK